MINNDARTFSQTACLHADSGYAVDHRQHALPDYGYVTSSQARDCLDMC